jgi:hypothetical protein
MAADGAVEHVFDRRNAVRPYRILAAEHGVVNPDTRTAKRVTTDRVE